MGGAHSDAGSGVSCVPKIAVCSMCDEELAFFGIREGYGFNRHFGLVDNRKGKVLPWGSSCVGVVVGANLVGRDSLVGKLIGSVVAYLINEECAAVARIGQSDVVNPSAIATLFYSVVFGIAERDDVVAGRNGE